MLVKEFLQSAKGATMTENAFKKWAAENKARKEKERAADKTSIVKHKAETAVSKQAQKEAIDKQLFSVVMSALSNTFPDGDPINQITRFLDRHNLTLQDVNRVLRKHGHPSYDKMVKSMWADASGDAVSDANYKIERGEKPEHSPFYDWKEGDKKVTPVENPWG